MEDKTYDIKWWSDYIDADILDRSKMVEELPFAKETYKLLLDDKVPLDTKKHCYNMMLQSFFDDCISEMYNYDNSKM